MFNRELKIAKKAAKLAAKYIRTCQQEKNFTINFKGRNDLVTDADVAAEKKILNIIQEHFPDDQILAEESSQERVLPVERTWIIDPIDGTTNFAHGFPIYCVSIALWQKRTPQMGVVLEVNSGKMFEAVAGEGAFLNGEAISVSSITKENHALIGTGFPYNDVSLMHNYLQFFHWLLQGVQAVRRPGAASYDLCSVAEGSYDGFYEYALNPWDVGAGALIVREAGGVISDWQGGDNWLFGKRIVAGNPDIHKFLLRAIQDHFTNEELR